MRKMKFFLSLVVVLLLCTSLTACAGEEKADEASSVPDAQLDAIDVRDDDPGDEPYVPPTVDFPVVPGLTPEDEIDPDFNPDADEEIPLPAQDTGEYRHQVGGAEFYTEHDLSKYIVDNGRGGGHFKIDFDSMLQDIWCENGGGIVSNSVGYSYSDGNDFTKGIWFDVEDSDIELLMHMATISRVVEGREYSTSIRIYECPRPSVGYYTLDIGGMAVHPDMAPLILLALEQMEYNPRNGALNDLPLGDNFYCD